MLKIWEIGMQRIKYHLIKAVCLEVPQIHPRLIQSLAFLATLDKSQENREKQLLSVSDEKERKDIA